MAIALAPSVRNSAGLSALQVVIGSLLLALSAQLVIPLPWTPVPIALHNTMAVFLGIALGPRLGALATLLYLFEGAVGLPVFSMGHAGLGWLAGPTGGYLIGFVPAAFFAGMIGGSTTGRLALACVGGGLVPFFFGVPYLANFVGWQAVWMAGFWPFIPGNVVKNLALATLLRQIRKNR